MTFLSVKNIYKSFGVNRINVLEDITLDVERGTIFSIVGESGCGKTTLLKIIAGLEEPSKGAIFLDGQMVLSPSLKLVPGHNNIKMVFQDSALQPNFTVQENILYQLKLYTNEYKQERLRTVVAICKLGGFLNYFPRQLSGGQKQRAALATALADDPLLLLLDEPFSNLDAIYKQEVQKTLLELAGASNTTVIIVTHDIQDAYFLASKIALIEAGKLLQMGTPEQLYQKPISIQSAKLTGALNIVPMEMFSGHMNLGAKIAAIRPEHIEFCTKKEKVWEGTIVSQKFMGAYFLTSIKINESVEILVNSKSACSESNKKVYLKFDSNSIITFED